ncbi:hypothetical protein SETIT_8G221700v2 [Setaria italica]|uniref:Uncharacterized protein n=1 Tax=Setaria italica TaxID=4555 RepID=A0A368SAD2_SETIT|nr:hypothetical protein SETIT_8G221700v2 [Setaria italica]
MSQWFNLITNARAFGILEINKQCKQQWRRIALASCWQRHSVTMKVLMLQENFSAVWRPIEANTYSDPSIF